MQDQGADQPGRPPDAVLAAMRRVLGPLVRVLIHFGIPYPALLGLLKRAYLAEAERGFALPGRPMSDSRIALLTGLHRKDISQLRQEAPEASPPAVAATLATQVVSRWIGHPDWRGDDGGPLALPRAPRPGDGGRSFEALVAGISRDIRPRTLLDELLRTGLVIEAPDGLLEVAAAAEVPRGGTDRLAYYFGRNLSDHLATAAHNLTGGAPPMLERTLAFDGLSPAAIAALAAQAEALGMEMLTRLNAAAVAMAESDPPTPATAQRFTAGIFVYSAPDPASAPPAGGTTP